MNKEEWVGTNNEGCVGMNNEGWVGISKEEYVDHGQGGVGRSWARRSR